MEIYSEPHQKTGLTLGFTEYAIFAKGLHGVVDTIDEHITIAGDDAILAMPDHGVFGVFDGATGANNGASLSAAESTRDYLLHIPLDKSSVDGQFNESVGDLRSAMRYIRKHVERRDAGLTTATIVRLNKWGREIVGFTYASAGDSVVLAYPDVAAVHREEQVRVIAGEQVGNKIGNFYDLSADSSTTPEDQVGAIRLKPGHTDSYLMLATDGINGGFSSFAELTESEITFAIEQEPRFKAALKKDNARKELHAIAEKHGFDLDKFNWDVWHDHVRQIVANRVGYSQVREPSLGEVARSIAEPRVIDEDIETSRRDDKSLIVIKLGGLVLG